MCGFTAMELTSGEIFFQLDNIRKAVGKNREAYKGLDGQFWAFLQSDREGISPSKQRNNSGKPQARTHNKELEHIKKVAEATIFSFKLKVNHNVLSSCKAIRNEKDHLLSDIKLKSKLYMSKVVNEQKIYDSQFLRLILEYYAILTHEIQLSRERLRIER